MPAAAFAVDDARLARAADQLVRLVDAPSVSGDEGPAVDAAEAIARDELGLPVARQPVAEGRDNLVVGDPAAALLLCTHLDTVPPFLPARREAGAVHGRGAADAKGTAIAMLHALDLLRGAGLGAGVGALLVVGEETDHAGARAAVAAGLRPRHVILGEPCGLAPARAQKGLLKVRLAARGVAAHSAYPELGASAVHRLLDALAAVRAAPLPADEELGDTTLNVGLVRGGVAGNVIAPEAEATVVLRCAAPVDAVLGALRERVGDLARLEVLTRTEPLRFDAAGEPPGPAVPFNTDAFAFAPHGARLTLLGPGDMRCAHGPAEHLALDALRDGIAAYARIAAGLLAPPPEKPLQ